MNRLSFYSLRRSVPRTFDVNRSRVVMVSQRTTCSARACTTIFADAPPACSCRRLVGGWFRRWERVSALRSVPSDFGGGRSAGRVALVRDVSSEAARVDVTQDRAAVDSAPETTSLRTLGLPGGVAEGSRVWFCKQLKGGRLQRLIGSFGQDVYGPVEIGRAHV